MGEYDGSFKFMGLVAVIILIGLLAIAVAVGTMF